MIRSLLAALVLSVSFFLIWPPGAAQASHDTATARVARLHLVCRNPDAVAMMFTAAEDRKEYWAEQVVMGQCFHPGGHVPVRIHGVVGEGVWLGDGLDDQMVILEVYDGQGEGGYTWAVKADWEAGSPSS